MLQKLGAKEKIKTTLKTPITQCYFRNKNRKAKTWKSVKLIRDWITKK